MQLGLQEYARHVFGQIKINQPDSVVAVVSGSESGNGIRDTGTENSNLTLLGEQGLTTSVVRVDASEFTTPAEGSTITVDGSEVTVTEVKSDPQRGLLTISYQDQEPVTYT